MYIVESEIFGDIASEFITQSESQLCQTMPKSKKGGPYPVNQKQKRQNEVYKLHFDHGYSARRIAEMMNVNRNTINGDLQYWYDAATKNKNYFDHEFYIAANLQRLDIQRSRLREKIDHTGNIRDQIALERLILDIDSKILYTYQKLSESSKRIFDTSVNSMNKWLKENNKDERYLSLLDKISVSSKAHQKIMQITKQDRTRVDLI